MNVAGAKTTVTVNTNMAKLADISALSISKNIEYSKYVCDFLFKTIRTF